jgi:small conductance mechanosensitive channel
MIHRKSLKNCKCVAIGLATAPVVPGAPGKIFPANPPKLQDAATLIFEKLEHWRLATVAHLPNLLVALLVLVLFWLVSRLARRGTSRLLQRTSVPAALAGLAATAAGFLAFLTGLFFALGVLGLDKTVTSLLAGFGILGLALGFALQDIAANFMAGVLLAFRRPVSVGEIVETQGITGVVEQIDLRSTYIRRPTGELVIIPNKAVFEKTIINYSRPSQRRVDLTVGVSYEDDLEQVREVAIAAIEVIPERDEAKPVELYFQEFGDSAIQLVVRFWASYHRRAEYLQARSAAIVAIKQAFDREGISIPFPTQVTMGPGDAGSRRGAAPPEPVPENPVG